MERGALLSTLLSSSAMKRAVAAVALVLTVLAGACGDPYECGPNDRDGDSDGRCNE